MAIANVHSHYVTTAESVVTRSASASRALDLSGIIDRNVSAISADAPFSAVLDRLTSSSVPGVPVADATGRYIGTVTIRSALAAALPIHPDSIMPGAGLGYLNLEREAAQARLAEASREPASELLDVEVPVVIGGTTLAQMILMLVRRSPIVVLLDGERRIIGITSRERALAALAPTK